MPEEKKKFDSHEFAKFTGKIFKNKKYKDLKFSWQPETDKIEVYFGKTLLGKIMTKTVMLAFYHHVETQREKDWQLIVNFLDAITSTEAKADKKAEKGQG